jgi:hypothetical protein
MVLANVMTRLESLQMIQDSLSISMDRESDRKQRTKSDELAEELLV